MPLSSRSITAPQLHTASTYCMTVASLSAEICKSKSMPPVMQVTITAPQLVTADTAPTLTIDFGARVAQLNPLLLYNITGVTRTDVVYDVNNGIVRITAYVDPSDGADIR